MVVKGGVWRLSDYASKRLVAGKPPKYAHGIDPGRSAISFANDGERAQAGNLIATPARIKCPRCEFVNEVV
jgi:hypothetical protein